MTKINKLWATLTPVSSVAEGSEMLSCFCWSLLLSRTPAGCFPLTTLEFRYEDQGFSWARENLVRLALSFSSRIILTLVGGRFWKRHFHEIVILCMRAFSLVSVVCCSFHCEIKFSVKIINLTEQHELMPDLNTSKEKKLFRACMMDEEQPREEDWNLVREQCIL